MRFLERCFTRYGQFISKHPFFFILIPTLLTIISTYGFLNFHSQDDIWDIYAPLNGRSRIEEEKMKQFEYASGSHHYRIQVLVSRKDERNVLQTEILQEIATAHKFVANNITSFNGEHKFAYKDICGIYCNESNAAVLAFLQASVNRTEQSQFRLSFPNAEAFNKKVFIGYSIGDLTMKNDLVIGARMLILHYMVDTSLPRGKELAADFEAKISSFFTTLTDSSPVIKYSILSRNRELIEQREITITSIPFLGLTIAALTVFMLITLVKLPFYTSQHFEAIIGVLSPGMALWTSAGFLWWAGFPFSNILTVVPFLVVTIGIDDAFLILAGWRQSTKGASLEVRMGETVAISGASVTVTSITDVACFATGFFSNMPVVQLFCLYTTVALTIDFFYQLTFFTAFVGIFVKKQVDIDIAENKSRAIREDNKEKTKSAAAGVFSCVPSINSDRKERTSLEIFIDVLHTVPVKLLVVALFLFHIGICSYFIKDVNTHFDMENLYLSDSPLTEISRKMQNFILRESFVVNFGIHPMPDLANDTIRDKLEEMVQRLETVERFGGGANYTNIWTRDYANAIAFWGDGEGFWSNEDLLNNFKEYDIDMKYFNVRKIEDEPTVDGFFFTITYHNISNFLEVESMLIQRRKILAEYSEYFTIYSHHPFEKVPTESAASAPINFIQTSVSAVVLMSILVLLFVMDIEAIVSVVLSIVSISLGIVVYLHMWGVNLDAVSLISMLMSIGFSVDYSAHICYHYFAHCTVPEELRKAHRYAETKYRLVETLKGVGWPVMQSGLSTILGMFPLMFVKAYIVAVFWKTVILVGVLGMLHALIVLPIIFILTHDLKGLFKKNHKVTPSTQTFGLAES